MTRLKRDMAKKKQVKQERKRKLTDMSGIRRRRAGEKPPEKLAKSNLAFRAISISDPRKPTDEDNVPADLEPGLVFDMVIASSNPVETEGYDYETDSFVDFDEVLEISERAIDISRLHTLPICLDHDIYNVEKHLGRAFNFRIVAAAESESGLDELWATGSIADVPEAQSIIEKVRTRHLVNISVGYKVPQGGFRDITGQEGTREGRTTLLATRWMLFEVSLLSVAADSVSYIRAAFSAVQQRNLEMANRRKKSQTSQRGAGRQKTRSQQAPANQAPEELRDEDGNLIDAEGRLIDQDGNLIDEEGRLIDEEGNLIEEDESEDDLEEDEDEDEDADPETDGQRSVRPADMRLRRLGAQVGIPSEFVERYVGTDVSPAAMITKWANEASQGATRAMRSGMGQSNGVNGMRASSGDARPSVRGGGITQTNIRSMTRAIAANIRGEEITSTEDRQFADIRTGNGLALRVMQMHGVRMPRNFEGTPMQFLGEAMQTRAISPHVTSDFDMIAGRIQEDFMMSAAEEIVFPGTPIARRRNQSNTLASSGWAAARFDPLLPNPEGSEVQGGSLQAYATVFELFEFARRYAASDQLLEADLGQFFTDTSLAFQNASVEAKIERMIEVLNSNPVMRDSIRFWSTKRANVLQNNPLTVEGVQAAQTALGKGRLIANATILAVPTDMLLAANKIAAVTNPNRSQDVNPWGGRLTVVEVPGMAEGSWMLMRSPAQTPTFFDLGKAGMNGPRVNAYRTAQFVGAEYQVVDYFNFAHGNPEGAVLSFVGAAPDTFEQTGQETAFGFTGN